MLLANTYLLTYLLTIYGEKFIVISNSFYNQYKFHVSHFHPKFSNGSSQRVFLPASDAVQLSQTNVSSSLTASFKSAGVLKQSDYQRVSCTRIRYALATFACNDLGFETGFFANHFMKNKEETTSLHYNLLSNRRHALSIAIKLYDSFCGIGGQEVKVNKQEADILVKDINISARNVSKKNVLNWLQEHDATLSKHEVEEFSNALDEFVELKYYKGNTRSFYAGGCDEEEGLYYILCTYYYYVRVSNTDVATGTHKPAVICW